MRSLAIGRPILLRRLAAGAAVAAAACAGTVETGTDGTATAGSTGTTAATAGTRGTGSGTGTTGGSDGTTGPGSTSAGSSTSATGSGGDSGTAGGVCGNGILEAGEVCDDGNTEDLDCCSADCTARVPLVFITDVPIAPGFGGSAAADALCNERAAEAGLPGTFRALLGSGGVGPSNDPSFVKQSAGYCRADYVRFANSWTDLVSNGPLVSLSVKPDGSKFVVDDLVFAWTGLTPLLNPSTKDCVGWTSTSEVDKGQAGYPFGNSLAWVTFGNGTKCDKPNGHLYCFEQSVP